MSSDQELAEAVLLNPDILDNYAIAMPRVSRGQWVANLIPVKAVGSDLDVHVFYWNVGRTFGFSTLLVKSHHVICAKAHLRDVAQK